VRAANDRFEIAWRVVDPLANAFVDAADDWADEITQFCCAISDEILWRHLTIGQGRPECAVEKGDQLGLRDRRAVEGECLPIEPVVGQKGGIGSGQFGAGGIAAFACARAVGDLAARLVAVDVLTSGST